MLELYKAYGFLSTVNHIMWYALIIAAIIFCASSLDDCFFDLIYWLNRFKKSFSKNKEKKIYYHELAMLPEKKIAVLIPCWNEEDVIRDMLINNLSQIDYKNYDVFIGIYLNDPATRAEIEKVQVDYTNLFYVVNTKEGPTTKADNLDSIYDYICERELEKNIKYDIYVLQDAEDIIHPLAFKLYNYAIDQYDMIQTPVFPLEVPHHSFTHWIYNDEFAEMHMNGMLVRGYIHGLVPSAGVGTAFSRKAIEILTQENLENVPFSKKSVTEDYDAALRLQKLGIKSTFFPFSITRIVKKRTWFGLGPLVLKEKQQIIATRALFPTNYFAAIKQRTRWVYGITLQAWTDIGWPGTAAIRYTLFHDRKSILTHFFNGFAYFILIYWIISYLTHGFYDYHLKTLSDYFDENPWVYFLIIISTLFMLERIANRAIFTGHIYGFWAAMLSIPRIIYANVLNIHTSYAAMRTFLFPSRRKWIKTSHTFPSEEQMAMYRRKIGDIMLDEGLISPKQLKNVMTEQSKTKDKIGEILLNYGYVNLKRLTELLAQQNHLDIIPVNQFSILKNNQINGLSAANYDWLITNKLLPIQLSGDTLTIAITDPSILSMRAEIQDKINPYNLKFVLISLSHKLGDLLVKKGLVTPQQIAAALADQITRSEKLGTVLVRKGFIKEEDLIHVLAEQYNLQVINLSQYKTLTAAQLPKIKSDTYKWLIDNKLTPISCANGVVTIVLADPGEENLKKMAMSNLLPYEVKFVLASSKV